MFMLSPETIVGLVKLNVFDLEKEKLFYIAEIGLALFEETPTDVLLKAQGSSQPILHLHKLTDFVTDEHTGTTGLFHTAFLLPTRKDFGNSLLWLLQQKVPLTGAADHGYSESLYLDDPEGNGIEIYHDKPKAVWDFRPNNQIWGVTKQLEADAVVAVADHQWLGLAPGSRIGHVHLRARDLDKMDAFYQQLGFILKMDWDTTAKFFAAGEYHHHIATNIWSGDHLPGPAANQLGLSFYQFKLPTAIDFQDFIRHLKSIAHPYQVIDAKTLALRDPSGLTVQFTY